MGSQLGAGLFLGQDGKFKITNSPSTPSLRKQKVGRSRDSFGGMKTQERDHLNPPALRNLMNRSDGSLRGTGGERGESGTKAAPRKQGSLPTPQASV